MKKFIFLTLLCNFFGCISTERLKAKKEEFCKMKLSHIEDSPQYTQKMKQCLYFIGSNPVFFMNNYNQKH